LKVKILQYSFGKILNVVRHLTRKVRRQLRNIIGSGTGKNKKQLLIKKEASL